MSDSTGAKSDSKANMSKFVEGVMIKGKLFGVETVEKETGDDICQDAMIKLKAIIAVKKEHKQRLNIKVDLEGIEIMDENMQLMYKHYVNRIAYIARDLKDSRAIGYIYKNIDSSCQYFGLRTEKQAQELFNLLKDLFEVVLEMRNNKKKVDETPTEPEKNPADKPTEIKNKDIDTSDKARLISLTESEPEPAPAPAPVSPVVPTTAPVSPATPAPEPVPAIKMPEPEPSLFDLSDPTTPAMDKSQTPTMDDLFGLGDLTLDGSTSPQVQTTPVASGMSNDLFSMINNPSPTVAAPNPLLQNPAMNFSPFGMQQLGMPSQFGQPQQQPFGMPMNMPQYNQQFPRAAPIPPKPSPTPASTPNKMPTNAFDDLFN